MKLKKESENVTSPLSGHCPECGAAIQKNTVYCPNCGVKVPLPLEENPLEPAMEGRHLQEFPAEREERRCCPECGYEIEEDAAFCMNCGRPVDHPELVQPMSEPSYPEQEPAYGAPVPSDNRSFLEKYKKIIIGIVIAVIIIAAGIAGSSYYQDSQYTKKCVTLSERLNRDNKSLVENARILSRAASEEEKGKAIQDIKMNKEEMESIVKENATLSAPSSLKADSINIGELLHKQADIYTAALFVIENPTENDAAKKLDEIDTLTKDSKTTAGMIHISGADFAAAVNNDNIVNYLKMYRNAALDKRRSDQSRQKLTPYIMSKNTYDQEIATLADDINAYLKKHFNLRGSPGYDSRASQIYSDIINKKKQLKDEMIYNTSLKNKLMEVYDAELGRVSGLRDGVFASKNGRDPNPAFQRGTAAMHKFDNVNAEFNTLFDQDKS